MTREEAIEVVKERLDYYEREKRLKEACETLIPELKESDDERMLREIKRYLKEQGDKPTGLPNGTVAVSDMIAWLEKQKEVGIRWFESDNIKNPEKPYIDKVGMFYTTDGRMCHASDIEKQKDILSERATNITVNMLEDGIEGIQRELIEFLSNTINAPWIDIIKSADSYAQRIKSMIEKQKDSDMEFHEGYTLGFSDGVKSVEQKEPHYTKRNALFDKCVENCDPAVMKKVSDEVDEMLEKEQKPAEWSEEDEKMLASFLHKVEVCDLLTNKENVWIVERLKSLRPSWKPSEEQLETLKKALYINPASGKLHYLKENEVCILQGLLKQLEKL